MDSDQIFDKVYSVLATALRIELQLFVISTALIVFLSVLCFINGPLTKFHYHIKFVIIFMAFVWCSVLFAPFFLFSPKSFFIARNFPSRWIKAATTALRVSMEVRNSKILEQNSGAVVCMNHQSALDGILVFLLMPILKTGAPTMKSDFLYVLPFGPCSWLAGVIFINRSSPKAAYRTLKNCADRMEKEKVKCMMFPEGTRNSKRELLPFKKGAFKLAIIGQVPIIPVVISPYYFIDHKKRSFDKGHIIIKALEPIPTKGMVDEDCEKLMRITQSRMEEEYTNLGKEIDDNSTKDEWRDLSRKRVAKY